MKSESSLCKIKKAIMIRQVPHSDLSALKYYYTKEENQLSSDKDVIILKKFLKKIFIEKHLEVFLKIR